MFVLFQIRILKALFSSEELLLQTGINTSTIDQPFLQKHYTSCSFLGFYIERRWRRTTRYCSAGRLLLLHVVVIFESSDESHLEIVSSAGHKLLQWNNLIGRTGHRAASLVSSSSVWIGLSESGSDSRVDLRGESGEDLGNQVALAAAGAGADGRGAPGSRAGSKP